MVKRKTNRTEDREQVTRSNALTARLPTVLPTFLHPDDQPIRTTDTPGFKPFAKLDYLLTLSTRDRNLELII